MGIFDRFRSAVQPAEDSQQTAGTSEQGATRLIEEGHVLEAERKLDEAIQCYLDAIRIAPNPARAHLNLGNALLLKGDLQGALDAFRTAIKHKPDYAGAHYNIGNALLGNKQFEGAAASHRQALEINPDYAEAHCALGIALQKLGQFEGAVECFKKALEINPDLAEARSSLDNILIAFYNQGNVLAGNGQKKDAVEIYRQVLEIEPSFAEAHCNLGLALQELGQLEDAEASLAHALEIKPDLVEAHYNLGITLLALGRSEDAVASFRQTLEIQPDYAGAHTNLGLALQNIGQLKNAESSYRQALEIKPGLAEAHTNLGNALLGLGQVDAAIASHRLALKAKPDYTAAHSNLLFALSCTDHSPAYYLDQARQFGQIVSNKAHARFRGHQYTAHPKRLRVGLVSGDLNQHPVGYFLESLLSHTDSSRIELIAYPTHHKEDELSARIRPFFFAWKSLLGKSDESAAGLIHADGVHILIDLSGHTAHNRLAVFAWKPSPIQVTWLGFPTTTGITEMDFVLGDPYAIPTEFENHFSETVWRMPQSYLCLTIPSRSVKVAQLPALSTGVITFGSFNNLTKMTDAVIAVWARILLSVPNSRLYLKTRLLNDADVVDKTLLRFSTFGISADRLLLANTLDSRDDHLAAYNKVDIALDTFPYPGVTTSVEALWMGVPVLSLRGDRFLSRTAESIAHNAGLSDWVAADKVEYVDKAIEYATNLERLSELRANLRERVLASPLFNAPDFARNFENALWGMWRHYQDKRETS